MRNKLAKSLMASVLALTIVAPTAACGGPSPDNGDTTYISAVNYGGGIGRKWLDEAIVRFTEKVKDVSYEEGKTGVRIGVNHNISNTMNVVTPASGDHIYFVVAMKNFQDYVAEGVLLEIDDVVKDVVDQRNGEDITIEEKIPEEFRYKFQGNDGKYYSLPYYEYLAGVSYNADIFDKYGLYIADPEDGGVEYDCTLTNQKVMLVADSDARKSCGNDGVYGTDDDGLPSSLFELVALCDYMKEECGVYPFSVSGRKVVYSNYFMKQLWSTLAGADETSTAWEFSGTADYVTGYSSENLFPGVNSIKAPTVEKNAEVSLATGYKGVNQVSKYYAAAFMELAVNQGWFDPRYTQSSYTHRDAMRAVVFSGIGGNAEVAIHLEGTYWYNEAESYGLYEEYNKWTNSEGYRNLKYFHTPTSLNETVVEGEGRVEAIWMEGGTHSVINANLANDPSKKGVLEACKDFLRFLYTDEEMRNFTKSTGASKGAIEYDVAPILDELSPFKLSVMAVTAAAEKEDAVIRVGSQNALYKANTGTFAWGDMSAGWRVELDAIDKYSSFLEAITASKTAAQCFDSVGFTEASWASSFSQYFE